MDKETKAKTITRLCIDHDCSKAISKIHFKQFVDQRWNPHPPKAFEDWWKYHKDCADGGVKARLAYNCQNYRDEWMEAKQIGAA